MKHDTLSPRHRESPLTRRSRDAPPPANNCLEVQWRFLQHKNPKPPQFGSSSRKPLLVDPLKPQISHTNDADSCSNSDHPSAPRGSPSRLFQMFNVQHVEAEDANTTNVGQVTTRQESSLPESPRTSRTLNDLMGETQRQAMLDRILADMEYLAVEPIYPRLGQPDTDKGAKVDPPRHSLRTKPHKPSIIRTALRNESSEVDPSKNQQQRRFSALWALSSQGYSDDPDDDDDDDDSFEEWNNDKKRRQRRKLQQINQEDDAVRIFWQKTSGARSAVDVPERLLTLSPSPPRRMASMHIVLGRRSHTPRNERSKDKLAPNAQENSRTPSTAAPRRRLRRNLHTPVSQPPIAAPVSPSKAHYGAWYVPQSEWWAMHQIEQQNITDKLPASTTATPDEAHCHGKHKPPLPPAALSPRSRESMQSTATKPPLRTTSSRMPSASSRAGGAAPPTSAPAPHELHVAGIPQSYIGREYRSYIISTGSTMPQYLQ